MSRRILGSIKRKLASLFDDKNPKLGADLNLGGKSIDFPTTANISDCLDEDDMSSDSATMLATQQSIKAYVDTNAKDLEFVSTAAITAATTIVVTGLAAGYDYIIQLEAFVPTDDAETLWMRWSDDGGVSYEAGAADYEWALSQAGTGSNDPSDAQIDMAVIFGDDAGNINTIQTTLVNPNASSEKTTAYWNGFVYSEDATPVPRTIIGGAAFKQGTDAVDAVQFLWSGGSTFAAQGDITVWRRKRS